MLLLQVKKQTWFRIINITVFYLPILSHWRVLGAVICMDLSLPIITVPSSPLATKDLPDACPEEASLCRNMCMVDCLVCFFSLYIFAWKQIMYHENSSLLMKTLSFGVYVLNLFKKLFLLHSIVIEAILSGHNFTVLRIEPKAVYDRQVLYH